MYGRCAVSTYMCFIDLCLCLKQHVWVCLASTWSDWLRKKQQRCLKEKRHSEERGSSKGRPGDSCASCLSDCDGTKDGCDLVDAAHAVCYGLCATRQFQVLSEAVLWLPETIHLHCSCTLSRLLLLVFKSKLNQSSAADKCQMCIILL